MTNPYDELLRVEGGRVLATLIRLTGDITTAEDAVSDAVLVAVERWPVIGVPRNPGAWLTTVARNKALDRIKREAARVDKERQAVSLLGSDPEPSTGVLRDDQLRLIFTVCHPALAPETRVALALNTVGRLHTREVARAFLVSEATMGQRLTRAKRKIVAARIPYRVPDDHELPDRLPSALATVYSIFTAGHHPAEGGLADRVNMCDEAIRLAELIHELMPDETEVVGLLALLLASHARRLARLDTVGDVVLLSDQDRSLWDRPSIERAARMLDAAIRRRQPGPYQTQAAIACLHGLAPTFADTDWVQIARLYGFLESQLPTPVVRVNRAVAVAEAEGAEAGLALLSDALAPTWHLFWVTRADLLRRIGDIDAACDALDRALACEMNDTDRRFLERRLLAIQSLSFQ